LPLVASTAPSNPTAAFPRGIKAEILEAGSTITRIHHENNDAIWFGPKPGLPPAYRFDAPGAEYRTMYAAAAIEGAFVETILHGRTEQQIVSQGYVDQRAWTELTLLRPLTLMKLYGDGLFWHRVDANISAAPDYMRSRTIALAAFTADANLDGLVYRSRHDNGELCFALFSRVTVADLALGPKLSFRIQETFRDSLMAKYGAAYDTSPPVPTPP
jgi:hypothetical protein